MEISKRATTLSQHLEDKRYKKAVEKHAYLEQIKPPFCAVVVGSSGSRKTSFALSLISDFQDAKYFDIIVLYTSSKDNNELFEKFETKKTEVRSINDYEEPEFMKFINKIEEINMKRKEDNKKLLNVLIVFDDIVGLPGYRMGTTAKPSQVDRLACNCRHINISVISLVQRYKLLNQVVRSSNCSALILMGLKPSEIRQVAEEHAFDLVDEDEFVDIYNEIRGKGDNSFMVVDYKVPKVYRIQENFSPYVLSLKK